MKKLTTILAATVLLISTTAFAGDPGLGNEAVATAFQKNFNGAANVSWKMENDFYFADFELDNKDVHAAFDAKGELLGVLRKIDAAQLPINIIRALNIQYEGFEVRNTVTEIVTNGETNYYVNVENSNRVINLKCSADGEIALEKSTRKKTVLKN